MGNFPEKFCFACINVYVFLQVSAEIWKLLHQKKKKSDNNLPWRSKFYLISKGKCNISGLDSRVFNYILWLLCMDAEEAWSCEWNCQGRSILPTCDKLILDCMRHISFPVWESDGPDPSVHCSLSQVPLISRDSYSSWTRL